MGMPITPRADSDYSQVVDLLWLFLLWVPIAMDERRYGLLMLAAYAGRVRISHEVDIARYKLFLRLLPDWLMVRGKDGLATTRKTCADARHALW